MFNYLKWSFLLYAIIGMELSTGEGLSLPCENEKFLSRNITRIWRTVNPKMTTIILHDLVDRDTCFGICNEIGSKGPITVVTFDHLMECPITPKDRISTSLMILFIYTGKECPSAAESQNIINIMRAECWWLHRVKLLYLMGTTDHCDGVKFIYQQFWELRFLKISIMTFDVQDTHNLTLHQCNPFNGSCERMRDPSFAEPFTDGVENMHGFPLKQLTVAEVPDGSNTRDNTTAINQVMENMEIEVVSLLAKKLNATGRRRIYIDQVGGDSTDDVNNMELSELSEGRSDILTFSVYIRQEANSADYVEKTTFSMYSRACALVPIEYQMVVNQLEGISVFLGMIPCIIGIAYVISILLRFQSETGTPLYIYFILVGGSLPHPPMRWPPRIFMFTWILSAMCISTAMQNQLMNSLMLKPRPTQIRTLSELDASGRILLAHPSMAYIVFESFQKNAAIQHIRDRSESYQTNAANCLQLIQESSRTNVTCLMETPAAQWFIKLTMRDNLPMFAVTDECFLQHYKGYMVPRGSPYLPSFNTLLLRMHDFGITAKISEDAMRSNFLMQPTNVIDLEFCSISWPSFRQGVFLTVIGYCISTVIFFLELINHYVINKQKLPMHRSN